MSLHSKNSSNKGSRFDLMSFLAGVVAATWACVILYTIAYADKGIANNYAGSDTNQSEVNQQVTAYATDIKDWEFELNSGETVVLHTPDSFYSLSDQYLENLSNYYGGTVTSSSIMVVGDTPTPTSASTIINVDSLSDVASMLGQLYGEEFNEEEVINSEAYVYMTTGELPTDLPDNYDIEEVGTYDVNGVEFVAYEVNYDTTYEGVDEDSTEVSTTVIHTQQIACYSKTDDSIEIIIYQETFDRIIALQLLQEVLGVAS